MGFMTGGSPFYSTPPRSVSGRRRWWRPDTEHATIAAASANYAVIGTVVMLDRERGPAGELVRASMWTAVILASTIAVLWFLHRMPHSGAGAITFGVVGDAFTAWFLFAMQSSADALVGAAIFAVAGAFFTFYLARHWLLLHMVFSTAVIVILAWTTIASGERDTYVTIARAYLIITVIQLLPFTIHGMWARLAREAQFANNDSLTGVLNRRGMLNYVDHKLNATHRGSLVACVVVDIDAFKSVNDTYGHIVGDAVLAHTATVLARSVAGSGVVSRTGGEEFTIVIIAAPYAVGSALAQLPTTVHGGDLPTITLSLGVATAYAVKGRAEVVWQTIARADRSMYDAKRAGGQQLVMAGDGE